MNRAYQSWSPRARPVEPYSALQSDYGCRDVFGNDWLGLLSFEESCALNHTANTSSVFNKPDTVSYATGPNTLGDPMPWATSWSAWVANGGVRIARDSHITLPALSYGSASDLYPTTAPDKLSLSFTGAGQIALAIQKSDTLIEIKWKRSDGTTVATASFTGKSPLLFNYGLVNHFTGPKLACYYLNDFAKGFLFARFEADDFATEYIVHTDLQKDISNLLAIVADGDRAFLYGRSTIGLDITLESKQYVLAFSDWLNFDAELISYFVSTTIPTLALGGETDGFGCSLVSFSTAAPVIAPPVQPPTDTDGFGITLDSYVVQ